MEPQEHFFARIGGNAGAGIAHLQRDAAAVIGNGDVNRCIGRRKRHRVIEQVFHQPFQPRAHAAHQRSRPTCDQFNPAAFIFGAVFASADDRLHQICQVNLFARGAAHFRIDPAGFGNLAHQPVNPAHIMGGNLDQFIAQRRVFYPWERFDCAPQAGERVLDFMRDIGGEAIDRVDPVTQCAGHIRNCAREQTDFIAALRQARHLDLAFAPLPHPHRRAGELAQRGNDGARQEQRKQRRCRHHYQHRNAQR